MLALPLLRSLSGGSELSRVLRPDGLYRKLRQNAANMPRGFELLKLMRIRPYIEADLEALKRCHARQDFDYEFPDLADPIFVSKLVLEDDSGRVAMASFARLTCEIYLLVNPAAGTPRERYAQLLALHVVAERDAFARGLEDAHAWLPPRIARRFGRRLEALGWVRDDAWTPYSKRLRG